MQLDLRKRRLDRVLSSLVFLGLCFFKFGIALSFPCVACAQDTPPSPFIVPDSFEVTEVASDALVHDAFCMTLDGLGRPVVSGPGYIRTLIDDDANGTFDRSITWAQLPKQGAQGLWSEGRDLYWVGDKGLWKSTDANGDLVGDGSPVKVLDLPTGGEHDAHAIRRGPDGSWYLIVGNLADGIARIQNDPASPVAKPRAGTLWRISPDFKTRGAWCHGMRNAYDFDFMPNGQIVTFDSDGERDITLPSYRPTRVMLLSPGSDAGWVGEGWKDPDLRVTMPRVLASLGRGSPTGVAVYRHYAFPKKYRDAVFVLDWTFGRVMAVYPERVKVSIEEPQNESLRLGAETFMASRGTMGFAPTDICVEPSGSLLISVGGRGTRGSLYRVAYQGEADPPKLFVEKNDHEKTEKGNAKSGLTQGTLVDPEMAQQLKDVVLAPCPLESWSEAKWKPAATKLGWTTIANAAINSLSSSDGGEHLSEEARAGAVQAMLRSGLAISPAVIEPLLEDGNADLQAMAWRALGWGRVSSKNNAVQKFQSRGWSKAERGSDWAMVLGNTAQLAQLEGIGMLRWPIPKPEPMAFESPESFCASQQVAYWAIARSVARQRSNNLDDLAARALQGTASNRIDSPLLDALARAVSEKPIADLSVGESIDTIDLLQAALGDPRHLVPPQKNTASPSIFDGYTARFSEQLSDKVSEAWVRWLVGVCTEPKNATEGELQMEAIRTIAMLKASTPKAVEHLIGYLEKDTHPTMDIHVLCAIACCRAKRTESQTKTMVATLLQLQREVREKGLNTDNHWQPRLAQLMERLMERDASLAPTMIKHEDFGTADHLLFAQALPAAMLPEVRSKILIKLEKLPLKEWSSPLLRFACGSKVDRRLQGVLRIALSEPALRSTVLEYLSKDPQPEDYRMYLEAIGSSDRSTWKHAWDGLSRLPIQDAKKELTNLMAFAIRSEESAAEPAVAKIFARMREAAKVSDWKPIPNADGTASWWDLFKANVAESEFSELESIRKPSGQWLVDVAASAKLSGDVSRGKLLFAQAKCSQCHGSGSALGPDLGGISKRFSREDLFRAIYEPSRDISDRYRAVRIITTDGQTITGMKVYDSADGVTLQAADGSLVRINQEDIEKKGLAELSMMPVGLMDPFSQQQLADLYAYLQSL